METQKRSRYDICSFALTSDWAVVESLCACILLHPVILLTFNRCC